MLSVLKDYILEEVKNADYLAIQADETTDISTHCQLVLVLRYIDIHNNVQERFFEFIPLQNATADTIATVLLERLSTILHEGQESRLIAQAYDGAAVMRGATGGVQCKTIRVSGNFDPTTVREARGFVRMLEDEDFCFFLALFHKIMPHMDMLFNQLQKRNIDSVYITGIIQRFTDSMQMIRDSIPSLHGEYSGSVQHQPTRKRRTLGQGEQQRLATEFPDSPLETTVEADPMLNKAKLKTELSLIYENDEFKACSGALTLFQFFMENNLQGTFTETASLLKILITTPMTTAESERCFSTLKRIKTFLRNTMTQDRLNALAMLSMEKNLIRNIPDFNNMVIESLTK
ncbi:hypothetical protein SKAU_G00059920 [Synaphobranchus kaupii]|uniref:HAT C-terminal dimerisation domain-containing protein n=1 Tax=Synaphobranchus kaupii TaxID=118154 RepID=A0A9Q1G4P4_SYNKA|nr:hypothetical protein SKAU_G00059920 [Synaphobranchus kaupii]